MRHPRAPGNAGACVVRHSIGRHCRLVARERYSRVEPSIGSAPAPTEFLQSLRVTKESRMSHQKVGCGVSALLVVIGLNSTGLAQDVLHIAAGLAGTWENSFSELGQNAGFFKKHGIELEIFYTQGAGETQQAVISGSADIGTGVGTFNTFGAFAKGAPIRVIAATHTGANDLTWYVRADSPIKDKKDLAGKSVAYSTAGSSTYAALQG